MLRSSGEAGVIPARARRREARIMLFLPDAANRGQAIGICREGEKATAPSRNIRLSGSVSLWRDASAILFCRTIINVWRNAK